MSEDIEAALAELAELRAEKEKQRAYQREYMRAYFQRPDVKEKQRAYFQRPDVKLRGKLSNAGLSKEAIDAELARFTPPSDPARRGSVTEPGKTRRGARVESAPHFSETE